MATDNVQSEKAWFEYPRQAPLREFVEATPLTDAGLEWHQRVFVIRNVAKLHAVYRDRRLGWGVPLEYVDHIELIDHIMHRDGDDVILRFHVQQISHQHEPHHIYADVTRLVTGGREG